MFYNPKGNWLLLAFSVSGKINFSKTILSFLIVLWLEKIEKPGGNKSILTVSLVSLA